MQFAIYLFGDACEIERSRRIGFPALYFTFDTNMFQRIIRKSGEITKSIRLGLPSLFNTWSCALVLPLVVVSGLD